MLQCCFKKKRRFFRRTGKIRLLKVCLTKRDNLIIYRKKDKGLILPLSAVKKTSVSTQAFVVSKDRRFMVCRYRLVFDIGTVNLFLANGYIPVWRDALDEIIDKYSRSQYTLPFEQSQGISPSCTPKNDDAGQNSDSPKSLDTISCENRSDRQQAASSTSYRSLKISPALQSTTSQYTEDSAKEPA
ncbi:hypothetical protein GCK32_010554 [Trichostrongylus colubriformis]|uniref:DUF7778 domain-containing protein n=1 Tax=Trichostrongylus colubriformis TaxID=6319 RepID=A0AAN8G0D7_TRICO